MARACTSHRRTSWSGSRARMSRTIATSPAGGPELAAFMARHGILAQPFMGADGHRFRESCLRPGDRVSVLGEVEEGTARLASGYRDSAPCHALVGTKEQPVVIFS